jgi:hypothetical protein
MDKIPNNIKKLEDYWTGLADGGVPDRSTFSIEELLPLLPYLLLVDFEFAPFRVRFRLSGTRVDQMTGMNLAGRYLDEFATGAYADSINQLGAYYEEASRTGIPRIWTYPWEGDNPKLKHIWVAIFPLKTNGQITQCVVIEDYGELNVIEDGALHPDNSANGRDWATLHKF